MNFVESQLEINCGNSLKLSGKGGKSGKHVPCKKLACKKTETWAPAPERIPRAPQFKFILPGLTVG